MILTPQSRRLDSSPILLRNTEEQKVTLRLVWAEKITYTNEGGPNIHYGSPSTL